MSYQERKERRDSHDEGPIGCHTRGQRIKAFGRTNGASVENGLACRERGDRVEHSERTGVR
jgi:hypothetical protein